MSDQYSIYISVSGVLCVLLIENGDLFIYCCKSLDITCLFSEILNKVLLNFIFLYVTFFCHSIYYIV